MAHGTLGSVAAVVCWRVVPGFLALASLGSGILALTGIPPCFLALACNGAGFLALEVTGANNMVRVRSRVALRRASCCSPCPS